MTASEHALSASGTVLIEPGSSAPTLGELWDFRELVAFLVWRDVKVRYKQTVLGVVWAILQPVVAMLLFTAIFSRLANLPSDGIPYPLFALAGLLPWQLFAGSLTSASNSLVGSAGLISKVYFPRLVIPLAAVGGTLVDFAIGMVLMGALMAWYGIAPSPALLMLPVFTLTAVVTAFAVGLWASAVNVRFRDVQYALPFLVQIWLFASPVAYSATLIQSPFWRRVYWLNPMAGVIQGFRWALLGAAPPGQEVILSLLAVGVLLGSGLWYFARTEATFADII